MARATRTDPKKGGGSGSGQRGDVAARCRCVPQFLLPSLTCETSATTVQLFKAELVRAQLPVLGLEAHLGDASEGARALADFVYGDMIGSIGVIDLAGPFCNYSGCPAQFLARRLVHLRRAFS